MRKIIFGLFLLLAATGLNAQGWINTYNGQSNGDDKGYGIVVDALGNIITSGYTTNDTSGIDIILIKYNPNGVQQWRSVYKGQGYNTDKAFGLAVDGSNNIIVTGFTTQTNGNIDYITLKYNANGILQWSKTYNGTGNGIDKAWGIAVDNTDNIFITGSSKGSSDNDCVTIKYNNAGNEIWNKRYNGPKNGDDAGTCITRDNNNNIYIAGYGIFELAGGYDYMLLKYNSGGTQQWVKNYNGTASDEDKAWGISVDNTNNIYITGTSLGDGTKTDIATLKYNSSGTQQWLNCFNGSEGENDKAYGIAVDNSTGSTYVIGTVETANTLQDYVTIKLNNSNGTVVWNKSYDGTGHNSDIPYALAISKNTANKHVLVAGVSRNGSTQQSEDIVVTAYSSAGINIKTERYNGSANLDDGAFGIAVDGNDNYYIAGYMGVNTGSSLLPSYDMITMKYFKVDVTGITQTNSSIPGKFSLNQNYPNPFNPSTTISFDIAELSQVSLAIYDISGRLAETVVNEQLIPGSYEVSINASKLSSGIYFYSLRAGSFTETRKMILVK